MMTSLVTTTNTATHISAGALAEPILTTVVAAPPEAPPAAAAPPTGTTGLIIVLVIGFILWRALDKKKTRPAFIVLAFTMGVLLSGSMIGVMANQTAGSIGQGLSTMFSTVTSNGGGTGTGR